MAGDPGVGDIGPDPDLAHLEYLQRPTGLAITLVTHTAGADLTGRGVLAGFCAAMATAGWFYTAWDDFDNIIEFVKA